MANEFIIKNGLKVQQGGIQSAGGIGVTGSLAATGGFTGSLLGNASTATSASFATYANSAGSATTATSASFATYANSAGSATSAATATSASFASTAPFAGITEKPTLVSGSAQINLSQATGTAATATSASFATYANTAGSATSAENATNAANINVSEKNDNVNYQVLFSTANGTGNQSIFIDTDDAHLTYNPSTRTLTSATFVGNLTGIATNATSASFATYANSAGSATSAATATSASFATYANTAGSATSATNASNINISATTSADTVTSVVLVADQATGNQSPFIDSGLTYNANTNALTATTFVGALTGNADTATALTSGDKTITGNLTVTGKVTAEEFHTEFISSSIIFSSGSTKFGDDSNDVHSFTGSLNLNTLNNATTDTDRFIVSDGGTLKYRTGAEVLSDIGAQASGNYVTDAGGATGQVAIWSSATAMSGSNGLYWSGSNLGVNVINPQAKLHVSGTTDVLLIQGSGSTANTTVFAVDGNNGRLFEISDDLSDSLFSVNTIAGLPVMEAFADNTVTLGAYNQYDLHITGSKVGFGKSNPAYKVDVNGTVAATALVETSARKFKEGIEPVADALNTVTQLQGVTFVRIGEENREYGFIADEVADVAPALVSYDENGNPYGVQYARTVAIQNEAIKELNDKVNSQELFIRDLLRRIEKLENK
jgi:hypothetical protein